MRIRVAVAASTSALFMLVGCTPFNPFAGIGTRQEVDRQAETWVQSNIRDYALTVALHCFCPNIKYAVEVEDFAPIKVSASDNSDLSHWPRRYRPETVEELHSLIRRFSEKADSVDVTYNDVGVPTSIAIDRDVNAIDDELGYTVRFAQT
jgi:uncharacterized protein DUF6174